MIYFRFTLKYFKYWIISSIIFLLFFGILSFQNSQTPLKYRTIEAFGGQAWYLPADGRLQEHIQYPLLDFTPYSVEPQMLKGKKLKGKNYTRITAKTSAAFFPEDIVGKSFCGLFAHENPGYVDHNKVDAYYPQEIASRYATVVYRLDAQNVLVDFEFNGGDADKPKKIVNGKGYFFFDNSQAWDKLRVAQTDAQNQIEEIKLQQFGIKNFVQQVYVIPKYNTWQFGQTDCKIWSGSSILPVLKIGFEDYYQYEKALGSSVVWQDDYLFKLPGHNIDHNLVVNALLLPPHRTILEASTFRRTVFVGRKAAGITALIGAKQLAEERYIMAGKGKTSETFISWSFSAISGGGRLQSEQLGVLQDVESFGYVLCKDYEQRGSMFTQMSGNAGNYLVVENADIYFENQGAVNPASQKLQVRLNATKNAYCGFPKQIFERKSYYLPYVLEIAGKGNFFKVFALGGSARTNIIAIESENGVLTFMQNAQGVRTDNPGEFVGYWEYCYVPYDKQYDWAWQNGKTAIPARIANKLMLYEQIPEIGKRYTISREYLMNESFAELTNGGKAKLATTNLNMKTASRTPAKGQVYSNVVRTAVCWTTVLQKYAVDINPKSEIPLNGKPLALQPGDQFTIPAYKGSTHDVHKIYTVMRKDRGIPYQNPAEFVGIKNRSDWKYGVSNTQSYRYFWCELDFDLPQDLPLTFEIEMVKSNALVLLDGQVRNALQVYKGINRLGDNGTGKPNTKNAQGLGGYDQNTPLSADNFNGAEALGHMCYSQVELTEWYKNVNFHNGYYRQNTNGGRGFKDYQVKTPEGKAVHVNPLARYSAGKIFINCTGGPVGQYTDHLNDFQVRYWILRDAGKSKTFAQRAKLELYNSPNVRTSGLMKPEAFLTIYKTNTNAPSMPKACSDLLANLH